MKTNELKRLLIRTIGDCIDEQSIPGVDSFIEMDHAVIHYAGEGGDRYFRVTLSEAPEEEYDHPYDPGPVLRANECVFVDTELHETQSLVGFLRGRAIVGVEIARDIPRLGHLILRLDNGVEVEISGNGEDTASIEILVHHSA